MNLKLKKSDQLQIEPGSRHFNDTFLKTQRLSFIFMVFIILLAILGLFGSGLFSHTIRTDNFLSIGYEKFIRKQASTIINIQLKGICQNESFISISKNFFEKISIKSINPAPIKEVSGIDQIYYYFLCNPLTDRIRIILVIEPEKFGVLHGKFVSNNQVTEISQFVYP